MYIPVYSYNGNKFLITLNGRGGVHKSHLIVGHSYPGYVFSYSNVCKDLVCIMEMRIGPVIPVIVCQHPSSLATHP